MPKAHQTAVVFVLVGLVLVLAATIGCASSSQQPHVTPDLASRTDAGTSDAAPTDAADLTAATNATSAPPNVVSVHSGNGDKVVAMICETHAAGKLTCRYNTLSINRGKQWSASEVVDDEKAMRARMRLDPPDWTKICRDITPDVVAAMDSGEGYPVGTSALLLDGCRTKNVEPIIAHATRLHQLESRTCALEAFTSIYEFDQINADVYQDVQQSDQGCRWTTVTTLFRDDKYPGFWNLKTSITPQPPSPHASTLLTHDCPIASDVTLRWGVAVPTRIATTSISSGVTLILITPRFESAGVARVV